MISPEFRRLLVEAKGAIYESRNKIIGSLTATDDPDADLSQAAIEILEQAATSLDQLISDAESRLGE